MTDKWFYVDGERTVGPEPFAKLLANLAARDDWQSLLVWRNGYNDWRRAADVPEISLYLKKPPPIPKPRIPPRAFTRTTPKATPWTDIPPRMDDSLIAPKTNPGETDQGANLGDDQKPKIRKLTSRLLAVLSFFGIFVAAVIGHSIGKPIGREVSNVILGSGRSIAEQIESGLIQAERRSAYAAKEARRLYDHGSNQSYGTDTTVRICCRSPGQRDISTFFFRLEGPTPSEHLFCDRQDARTWCHNGVQLS